MDKVKTFPRKTRILSIVAVILLVVGIYGMNSPIAYGSGYYHTSYYEGEDFTGCMIFYPDNTMVVRNTNLDDEMQFFYYYKEGYIFVTVAQTEEEYKAEVAAINEDFEGALNTPFYASKITAFKLTSEGLEDDYSTVYICQNSMMMAVAWSVIELALVVFILITVARQKKRNQEATKNNNNMEEIQ